MTVGLLIVSHSQKLAEGVLELAQQMAADVTMIAAGGTEDGGLGTSLEKISAGITEVLHSADSVAIMTDLGSAVMTSETALELQGTQAAKVIDAPLVEGTIAAAVAAQVGGTLAEVERAAQQALASASHLDGHLGAHDASPGAGHASNPLPGSSWEAGTGRPVVADVELINPMGLHARPAATLAAALGMMEAEISINGVDGQSVMMLMTLGAEKGAVLHVEATGPDARRAVDLITQEVESGFGEI